MVDEVFFLVDGPHIILSIARKRNFTYSKNMNTINKGHSGVGPYIVGREI